jgi:hypothetical protein
MTNMFIDLLFELRYMFLRKKLKPTFLVLSIDRFTNSSWLEDLYCYKTLDDYLYTGKGSTN